VTSPATIAWIDYLAGRARFEAGQDPTAALAAVRVAVATLQRERDPFLLEQDTAAVWLARHDTIDKYTDSTGSGASRQSSGVRGAKGLYDNEPLRGELA